MTECTKGCMACCDPVILDDENKKALDYTLLFPHLVEDLDTKKNANFAARNWRYRNQQTINGETYHAFDCRFLDRENQRCTAHDKRPPICRSYPQPDLIENGQLHKTCSYWGQVPGYKGPVPPELPPGAIPLNIVETK